jgi:hypothetical protein
MLGKKEMTMAIFQGIGDEIRRLASALQQRGTWFFLAVLAVFSGIVYLTFRYALRMDFLLRVHRLTDSNCGNMDNPTMLTVFCASIFFGLALVVSFGEMARHAEFSRHQAWRQARGAAWLCAGWIALALAIGATMLAILVRHCA